MYAALLFLSTSSARRATTRYPCDGDGPQISIHALREEGDQILTLLQRFRPLISIHALREEGDVFS